MIFLFFLSLSLLSLTQTRVDVIFFIQNDTVDVHIHTRAAANKYSGAEHDRWAEAFAKHIHKCVVSRFPDTELSAAND